MSEINPNEACYYYQDLDNLVKEFNTNLDRGLEKSNMDERYARYGYNELPKIKKSLWKIYLAPLFNFLIVILIITGIIIIILGSPESTIITWTVIIINSSTAIIQQFRAQKALESLRRISALKATVIREGKQEEIPTRELLPGDIMVLKQGDKIPADGRIIEYRNLSVDESALTGESEAVEKNMDPLDVSCREIQKQKNMVFMGTYVHEGRGKALVTNTGIKTEIGKISQTLNAMGSIEDIPLTRKLNKLGYILGTIVCINLTILIIYKFTMLQLQDNFVQSAITKALVDSILRAMNIVPINLPLLSTLVLITGVLNMAQNGVIIKNLSSIESLGRVSVICSDKTGTITKNEMTVESFWINNEEFNVSGSGFDSEGEITQNNYKVNINDNPTFQIFIDSIILNNNAELVFEDVKVRVGGTREKAIRRALGSPTEAALIVLAEKAGFQPYDIKGKYEILREFSFSSEVKRMTTICNTIKEDPIIFAFTKGAPERILDICDRIEVNGEIQSLEDSKRQEILNLILKGANLGYRTLAIAYKAMQYTDDIKREDAEKNLIFIGFVSIMDPPRAGVKESVHECRTGGIRVIMITGDHPATAKTIAKNMDIYQEGDLVAEGSEINSLSKEDMDKVSVFARVAPADKEIIVDHYQSKGKIVAMTGDGINDSPALKLANAGVAMGITGTDLAKETADMVITDDDFTSITKGVKIGRGLFSKIRSIIYFFILTNIMEATIFFTYEFIPTFDLFATNWQHIYIFGIVHSFPSLALVIDTHPKDIMNQPPRNDEELLNRNIWIMLLIQAFLMGLGIVLALQLTLGGVVPLNEWNISPQLSYIPDNADTTMLTHMKARTMFITTIYILETNFIWTFRRPNQSIVKSIKEETSYTLLFVLAFTMMLHVLVICFSASLNYAINDVLSLNLQLNYMFLSVTDWLICIALALPGIFGIEILKYFARKRQIFF
ncbi:MAG: cation-translocating P-type ATPase [Promethearchaeota archaeon]